MKKKVFVADKTIKVNEELLRSLKVLAIDLELQYKRHFTIADVISFLYNEYYVDN